jgi:PmbA protein
MSKIQTIAQDAKEAAAKLGIAKFDIFGSTVDETSVQVNEGEPEQMKASQRSGVTVRVWNPAGPVGITSTTDVDRVGLELALKTAYEASAFGAKENIPDFSPEATTPIATHNAPAFEPSPVSKLLSILVRAEKALVDSHEAIVAVPYNGLAEKASERFYINSNGATRHEAHAISSVYVYTKTEQEDKKPRSAGAFRIAYKVDDLDIDACVKEAADKTISHLNYAKIETGKYRVVFSPEAILGLVGAFSNMFNAQSILDNQSLSTAASLGEPIASPLLSLNDDEHHPENLGASGFDGEGTPTRCVPLITNGVLTSFIHSAGTAKRMNTSPTGNASMGAKVGVSRNFLHLFAGVPATETYSLDTAENVILIDELEALHAGVQSLQGSFSLPFNGWLVNKGVKTSIESATIAGDIRTVLKSILYVEPKTEFTGSGVAPNVWVEDMSITGG